MISSIKYLVKVKKRKKMFLAFLIQRRHGRASKPGVWGPLIMHILRSTAPVGIQLWTSHSGSLAHINAHVHVWPALYSLTVLRREAQEKAPSFWNRVNITLPFKICTTLQIYKYQNNNKTTFWKKICSIFDILFF